MSEYKKTSLYDLHVNAGAKMAPFAGYEMPIQYSGIVEEHMSVRKSVGVFDVSHMGEFEVTGDGALEFLQLMTLNDVSKLELGQAQYSGLCYEDGGMLDDLLVYRLPGKYMIVVNASNIEKDFKWLDSHKPIDVELKNVSEETALIAVQGKNSKKVIEKLTDTNLDEIKYYRFESGSISGKNALISKTGYTGEKGFELYFNSADAPDVWSELMSAGEEFGILQAGLGARDTLRLEMCYCLYGNDIDNTTSPLEAGLGWITKLKKGKFIGSDALKAQKEEGIKRRLVAFQMEKKAIPRHGYEILKNENVIGEVTSGTFSPVLQTGIGLGYVTAENHEVGTNLTIDIRGRKQSAQIIKPPFYTP